MYFLLLFLIVWKYECFYELWVQFVWYHLSSSNLHPFFIMLWKMTASTDQFWFFTLFLWCSTMEFDILTLFTLFLTLNELIIIYFFYCIVTFINCDNWICGAKSFHKREILTSYRQFNVDCMLFIFYSKCNIRNLNHINVIMFLVCVFVSLWILRGLLNWWLLFLFFLYNNCFLHCKIFECSIG